MLLPNLPGLFSCLSLQHHHEAPHSQHQSPLLRLPRELRDEIYGHILRDLTLTLTKADLRYIEFSSNATTALPSTCKRLHEEFKESIKGALRDAVRELTNGAIIYPFRSQDWAAQLAVNGSVCDICEDTVSVKIGHVRPLRIRVEPCECHARQLPASPPRHDFPESARRSLADVCAMHAQALRKGTEVLTGKGWAKSAYEPLEGSRGRLWAYEKEASVREREMRGFWPS